MQSILSRIWTRVAVSISYDNNHYTTGTSTAIHIYAHIKMTSDLSFPYQRGLEYTVSPAEG